MVSSPSLSSFDDAVDTIVAALTDRAAGIARRGSSAQFDVESDEGGDRDQRHELRNRERC